MSKTEPLAAADQHAANPSSPIPLRRRTIVQAAAGASLLQVASPFIITARAADTVKLGLDNPLTGTYAAVGKNELIGCQLAVEQINAKGGILGRQAELLSEDSTSGDAGTAVQKARKLIDRDKVNFLLGNVNSALSLAMAQVAAEKNVLLMVTGGHTDAVATTTSFASATRRKWKRTP
jgi:branched-chain amino acid transport system substrate-binding protein